MCQNINRVNQYSTRLLWRELWAETYRAEACILQLVEARLTGRCTQLNITKHNLKCCVVNCLREVHVQLIHRSLQMKQNEVSVNPIWGMEETLNDSILLVIIR